MKVHDKDDFSVEYVETYEQTRIGYSLELAEAIASQVGLQSNQTVVDLGSGTGLFAKPFLELGYNVIGVEPSNRMRQMAQLQLSDYPNFVSAAGKAEASKLPDKVADLIIAGQAAHHFMNEATREEFSRILKPEGHLVLVWTYLAKQDCPIADDIHELILSYRGQENEFDFQQTTEAMATQFAGMVPDKLTFKNQKYMDLPALLRYFSIYPLTPNVEDEWHSAAIRKLHNIFEKHQVGQKVSLNYDVFVYLFPSTTSAWNAS